MLAAWTCAFLTTHARTIDLTQCHTAAVGQFPLVEAFFHACVFLEGMSTCAGKGSSDASRSASPSEACPPDTDISESDDERSCDADDELSCVESSHSHTIAWWDEVDMCLGGSELSAEREQGDLLEMALDSLSLAGRRGKLTT